MNALRKMRWWAVLAALVLLAGCGGGGTGGNDSLGDSGGAGAENAGLDFVLTSFARVHPGAGGLAVARQAGGGGGLDIAAAAGGNVPSTVEVTGEMLAVEAGGTELTFHFNLLVDETAFTIPGAVDVPLPAGTYDFYFLLEAGGRYYAGVAPPQQVIVPSGGGLVQNHISFTLNPVIADGTVTVQTIRELAEFRFRYNAVEIETYDDPAFSISVDGSAENIFNINTATGLPFVYVLLPPGTYHFVLKFYDGANLKLVAEDDVDIGEGGGGADIDVAPIITQVLYTYTPSGSPETDTGDITFIVPNAIVQEGGGIGTLRATASVVGPLTPLSEYLLQLNPQDGAYAATINVPGLTSGPLTWSIQFRDTTSVQSGELFAYCAESVTIPEPQGNQIVTGQFFCEPRMIARNVSTDDPPAPLTISVQDPENDVPGAVILADDLPIGITSGGGIVTGTEGLLESFLKADLYRLKARREQLDPFGSGQIVTRTGYLDVGLFPGQPRDVVIQLPSLVPASENCVDGSVLTASKTYEGATKWYDGACTMAAPMLVTVSEAFTVLQGDVGNHWAKLYFENQDGSRVVCMYQGNGNAQGDGIAYILHSCHDTDPPGENPPAGGLDLGVGSQVLVDGSVRLRVNGSNHHGPTVVRWTMEAVPPPAEPPPEEPGDDVTPPADDGGDVNAPELDYIELTASRQSRPRRFFDEHVRLAGWAKIRIPGNDRIAVTQGDPERFLMIVYFGRGVKCWYMGGQWDESLGGWMESFFRGTFNSPACTQGKQVGDTIWVRGPIKARVVAGSPRFNLTEVVAQLPVLRARERGDDHEFDRSRHHRRHHWHWWWWRQYDDDRGGHFGDDDHGRGNGHGVRD